MTFCLKLNSLVNYGPVCYMNFYHHHAHTIVIGPAHIESINELLSTEPCNVKFVERHVIRKSDNRDIAWEGWLEFETEEDYVEFVLRWS
jgi:hypothetical protein